MDDQQLLIRYMNAWISLNSTRGVTADSLYDAFLLLPPCPMSFPEWKEKMLSFEDDAPETPEDYLMQKEAEKPGDPLDRLLAGSKFIDMGILKVEQSEKVG